MSLGATLCGAGHFRLQIRSRSLQPIGGQTVLCSHIFRKSSFQGKDFRLFKPDSFAVHHYFDITYSVLATVVMKLPVFYLSGWDRGERCSATTVGDGASRLHKEAPRCSGGTCLQSPCSSGKSVEPYVLERSFLSDLSSDHNLLILIHVFVQAGVNVLFCAQDCFCLKSCCRGRLFLFFFFLYSIVFVFCRFLLFFSLFCLFSVLSFLVSSLSSATVSVFFPWTRPLC